jgi:hypothetical protein
MVFRFSLKMMRKQKFKRRERAAKKTGRNGLNGSREG